MRPPDPDDERLDSRIDEAIAFQRQIQAGKLDVPLTVDSLTTYLLATDARQRWASRAERLGFEPTRGAFPDAGASLALAFTKPLVKQLIDLGVRSVLDLDRILLQAEPCGDDAFRDLLRSSSHHAFRPAAVPTHVILWIAIFALHPSSEWIWSRPDIPDLVSSLVVLAGKYPRTIESGNREAM